MYYLDSKLTVTCRGSSLIRSNEVDTEAEQQDDFTSASKQLPVTSTRSLTASPGGTVERELVTLLFETMLEYIVESWTVIESKVVDNAFLGNINLTTPSETTVGAGKRKKGKNAKEKPAEQPVVTATPISWWSGPDELVKITFINGNTYEGNISMKCMHGKGKFQWATGTSYMGDFYYNKLCGKGIIEWRNETWYEGDFTESMRHGYGMFVNSREQLCYIGYWQSGTKNGTGTIYYSHSSLYEGSWIRNIREGFGSREYCAISGYKGNWEQYNRNGRGIMIWPNHDFYCGEWTDGVMNGHGTYVWSVHRNGTMSVSSQISYKGYWKNGMRHGHGIVRFGFANGSHYKGQFLENKKHGKGSLVTENGTVLQSKELFNHDHLPSAAMDDGSSSYSTTDTSDVEPHINYNNMSTEQFDVSYHVNKAAKKVDSRELLQKVIDIYIINNKKRSKNVSKIPIGVNASPPRVSERHLNINIEYKELQKALDCYEMELKHIYYQYATLCNSTEIAFTPILIRFYMWQFYYDCKINLKGLTFVEVDEMLYRNPAWLIKSRHDPFERIYYWQFLHSLISVAIKLYFQPAGQCDTVFRKFMMEDVIPNIRKNTGSLRTICAENISLKAAYKLYQSIGEPHTIREFLRAVRYPPHLRNVRQLTRAEANPEEDIRRGRNMFTVEDQPHFFFEKSLFGKPITRSMSINNEMKLFILEVLSSKAIIKFFAKVFPHILVKDDILNLGIKKAMMKKPAQVLFTKNSYSKGVKVHFWEYAPEAEVKDHDVYAEFISNHVSTYNRWGNDDQGVKTTETRDMLEQIWTKIDPVYESKPLVNFTSYPCTDTPGRNKLMEKANLAQLPLDYGAMDYLSTQQDDYRNPNPSVLKPLTMKSAPWLVNRVIRSDLTHNHGTAPPKGNYQCLDTHTPIQHIRELKHFRYLSFDPGSGLQDFP